MRKAGCCRPSSPSATSRAATLPRCARATSAWYGRAPRMPPSSWGRSAGQPRPARRAALDAVTFQAKLGSLGDKTRRVSALAAEIAVAAGGSREHTRRAAELCKCDLLTAMVGEFPELQGIMGSYYAQADGG